MTAPEPASPDHPPSPDTPPGLDGLMVFDAACNLCSGAVRLIAALDRQGAIRFAPLQSPAGRVLCERHGVDPDDPTTFLFLDRGRALEASEGVLTLAARLPRPWRWLRILGAIPRPVRDAAYLWLARHRYRLFGRRACAIPDAALRARLVDVDLPGP